MTSAGRATFAAASLLAFVSISTPAIAEPVLQFNSGACTVADSSFGGVALFGDCSDNLQPVLSDGSNGLDLFSSTGAGVSSAGSGKPFGLVMDWKGTTNGGAFNGSLPLSWDFWTTSARFAFWSGGSVEFGPPTWTLDFYFNNKATDVHFTGSSGDTLPSEIKGSSSVNLSGPVNNWEVTLEVDAFDNSGCSCDLLTVSPPDTPLGAPGSILINNGSAVTPPPPAVPEPASIFFLVPAMGAVILFRTRAARCSSAAAK
jgi:hypothetical protein